ncbi:peptidoglycan-associated lipoprotein Pal [Wenzhouxiangella marina]|uniref:Peptidoglycan-associated lipoprotein n=1 Tax=Wenzhouxiangella marina TaxID=1579979 RepID=A0A0K0XTF3_9GAMM|nr:peptidoglycan-associated lipoprotein Pal [Wenzhouxiangella marina]AKS40902.1 membrane protein [Wenzhouxiangella marina]MBB6087776.1 peptidoglycan-associated lipoprotein [Wenzhouxiangella marina]
MNTALRLIAIVTLAALMAACARQTTPEPEPTTPEPPPVERQPVETDRLDPRDFTDVRNLDNPDSLLSQRVIYFEFDRSNVRAQFRPIIEAHAQYMRANPSARVILEGHADERGSREYNLGLGERRGNAVSEAVEANGGAERQIEVVSYGEERPVCRDSNEDCWQRNRRVEIVYTAR